MRVRDFVFNVRQVLGEVPKNPSIKDVKVLKESEETLKELHVLCWLDEDSDDFVSSFSLLSFITFLAERAERLSKELPHAHYTSAEVTDANFACMGLAKLLAATIHTKEAQRKKPLEFLLPNLKVDAATALQFIRCPQDFVLNADATELTKVNYNKQELHSIPSALDCEELNKLTTALSTLNYGHRREYLNTFPMQKVAELLLQGKGFRDAVNEQAYYVGGEEQARNVLMTFGYYYHELTRTRSSDYKRLTAGLSGYDKAVKLKVTNLILAFLDSGENLAKFEDYLNSEAFKEHVPTLLTKEKYTLKDVALQGELGDFCKRITFASNPKNREPVEVQPTRWFGRS